MVAFFRWLVGKFFTNRDLLFRARHFFGLDLECSAPRCIRRVDVVIDNSCERGVGCLRGIGFDGKREGY